MNDFEQKRTRSCRNKTSCSDRPQPFLCIADPDTIRTAEDASISFILLVAFVKDWPNLDGKATQQAS
ncbi:hypothetical protein BLNAU_17944 [Blattamonas nauphoetae]|uniref:Uncharacterized protein n=1 Tax=Blattamonas nauphoetae TaxID=2049346 RepID=A0ABQ9X5V1_9EUKA|nr:hypothetical protein BLNAU_17944 [Blattamonas nauphoetae]